MDDPFSSRREEFSFHRAQKLRGTINGLFKADGKDFVTAPVSELPLTFEGIPGDFHAGLTRKSGGREPWYTRGTVIRNERQLSVLATDELRVIARRLNVSHLKAEWIGGNILLDGVPNLTRLPPRTILMFDNGATIRIDGDNLPCSHSGRSIASNFPGREDLEQAFVKHAKGLRGLVGWVEKPGILSVDEGFEARLPEQWIYTA